MAACRNGLSASAPSSPLPLRERVARREAARRVRGYLREQTSHICVRGDNPSSGASRHLLPQGEKDWHRGCG
ncbi:hypothetical protein BF49_5216 [Bradyrhizobium sp.]|nr:hypothetical protein BF49_5216 [Bradyrhizobium sp.]